MIEEDSDILRNAHKNLTTCNGQQTPDPFF